MESFENLLHLPTAQESVTDRWFLFTSEHWRNTREYQATDDLDGYENHGLNEESKAHLHAWRTERK
jgi:hypothetical protein